LDEFQNPRPDAVKPAEDQPSASPGSAEPPTNGMVTEAPEPDPAPPPPPLTVSGWLAQNGVYVALFVVAIVWLYSNWGLDGVWKAGVAVVGLGFVIFVHELGHFLAAKWCDVHVQTFSIGFGPALPGCSFQRGETLYKIAILPLGGYVNMVGEGFDIDEGEDYPRSFKNKSVGQRMLIISAGVIMNVLLGCVCFIGVYRFHGIERPPAIVGKVEPGSPAWQKGVRTADVVERINKTEHPWFDDLKVAVAFSGRDQQIPFTFKHHPAPDGSDLPPLQVDLKPRKEPDDAAPVIGVTPASRLRLPQRSAARYMDHPTVPGSPAAAARRADVRPGDVVAAAKVAELCARLTEPELAGEPLKLTVRRDGKEVEVVLPPSGFDFEDVLVGTTDPATPDETFRIKELPLDPNNPGGQNRDPFEFRRRLRLLAGLPMVVQVQRAGAAEPVNILVPPAFTLTFGLHMKMGEVAAVRDDSPAAGAGFITAEPGKTGDVITAVSLAVKGGPDEPVFGPRAEMQDPMRLPWELARRVEQARLAGKGPVKVKVTVLRANLPDHRTEERTLEPMDWDDGWRFQDDYPISAGSPLSIPQLGLAYRVESTVAQVVPGKSAAEKGLQPNDQLVEIRLWESARKADKKGEFSRWAEMKSVRGPGRSEVYDQWPYYFTAIQTGWIRKIEVKVKRGEQVLEPFTLEAVEDRGWPRPEGGGDGLRWPQEERGLLLSPDRRLQKAGSMMEAVGYGVEQTSSFIKQIYLNLSRLFERRISTKTLGGPIEIAAQAFEAAEDPYIFVLFLGLISVNLAVVNFLPIPVLDGGHMVFLIYEKIRGRRPSETVQAVATYLGLAILAALMIFVFYLDISRRWGGK
jgi:regulator of sigma E protease